MGRGGSANGDDAGPRGGHAPGLDARVAKCGVLAGWTPGMFLGVCRVRNSPRRLQIQAPARVQRAGIVARARSRHGIF